MGEGGGGGLGLPVTPPFCKPFLNKKTTTGDENEITTWWVPSFWHRVTPASLKNPGYTPVNKQNLYLMLIFKSLSFCSAEWSLSSTCLTSFPITWVLDRSAATSLCSAVSGLEPLSFDSASSFAGTFQNKKTHWLCFGLVIAVDILLLFLQQF